MDWLKAWRWSSLRIHNNLIFVLPLTCITKVTPLLRHMHTSSANAQKDVFSCLHLAFAPFIHPLLPFLQHLFHSLHPIWGITRKYKNTTETFLLKKNKKQNRSKTCFLKYPILPPSLGMFCSLAAVCLHPVWSEERGKKEWRGATARSTRLQYKNEQNWTGGGCGGGGGGVDPLPAESSTTWSIQMQDLNYLSTPLTLLSLAEGRLQTDEPVRGDEMLSPVGLLLTRTHTHTHAQPKGKADAFDDSR